MCFVFKEESGLKLPKLLGCQAGLLIPFSSVNILTRLRLIKENIRVQVTKSEVETPNRRTSQLREAADVGWA
jgi:hypothetical protein